MNKILMMGAFTGAMVFSLPASAADGQLNFKGNVVTAPCNISADQADQTIDLGSYNTVGGYQPSTRFTITLTDCTATPAKISWSGTHTLDEMYLDTTTPDLYLAIQMNAGAIISYDDAPHNLPYFTEGTNVIHFKVTLKEFIGWSAIPVGPYTASAEFTMHYE